MRIAIAADERTGVADAVLEEILDAWFAGTPSPEADDRANVAHLDEI